jgi:hypothetical protein
MGRFTPDEECVAEKLAFHFLREAYYDLASALLARDECSGRDLLHKIEVRSAGNIAAFDAGASSAASSDVLESVGLWTSPRGVEGWDQKIMPRCGW